MDQNLCISLETNIAETWIRTLRRVCTVYNRLSKTYELRSVWDEHQSQRFGCEQKMVKQQLHDF